MFPPVDAADADGLLAVGADLEPGTLLAAYRSGIFPMPLTAHVIGWWSPDPRGVLPLDRLHVSHSLRRHLSRFDIRVDTSFEAVIDGCASPARRGGWITAAMREAYRVLHELGWAHSVEAWSADDGDLAGGLYGVVIGGLFAGESMFSRGVDASKAALVALVSFLAEAEGGPEHAAAAGRLLDVQWATGHLRSLGACEVSRAEYLQRLSRALSLPAPPRLGG